MLTPRFAKAPAGRACLHQWLLVLVVAITMLPAATVVAATPSAGAEPIFERGDPSAWLEQGPQFLAVDEAFALTLTLQPNRVMLARWEIADGYYLYRHQFAARLRATDSGAALAALRIPTGLAKVDEFCGEVEVYYGAVAVQIPLVGSLPDGAEISIDYQGCADAGLCYPPETRVFKVSGNALLPAAAAAQRDSVSAAPRSVGVSQDREMAQVLQASSFAVSLALFFVAGIGLAFTPCVFPMVPILSTIIVGEGAGLTKRRAFTLSLAYVLGMALTYALVGLLVGLFGAELNLQAALQSPIVLSLFAVVFVLLSGAMFGFYELALPQGVQQWIDERSAKQSGGRHPSVFVMGSLSSLVVSPCMSAPLAGALIYLSNTGDAVLGGSALFALGLGMGVPLLVVGGSGGHWLPRAGVWMNTVKGIFGFGLLGVAIWLLERLLPGSVALMLWAAWLIAAAVYLGAFEFSPKQAGARFAQVAGLMMAVWGSACLVGASAGGVDPFKPLAGLGAAVGSEARSQEVRWQAVKSTADIEQAMAGTSAPVLLDLYADWCISCKVMERNVFPVPEVAKKLSQFTLLRADVTANDAIDQALLKKFGLFGPPSLVFFHEDGRELSEFRVQGEVDADRLSTQLGLVLAASKR
ncbi:MAG: protein-disulfide reductase DsbD [Proteobacteria bacterium]|nr:protein-disulfide reductase DsbD [Pseudomonadota bacterium]